MLSKKKIAIALVVLAGIVLAGCASNVRVNVHVDCPKTCVDVKADNPSGQTPPRPQVGG